MQQKNLFHLLQYRGPSGQIPFPHKERDAEHFVAADGGAVVAQQEGDVIFFLDDPDSLRVLVARVPRSLVLQALLDSEQ